MKVLFVGSAHSGERLFPNGNGIVVTRIARLTDISRSFGKRAFDIVVIDATDASPFDFAMVIAAVRNGAGKASIYALSDGGIGQRTALLHAGADEVLKVGLSASEFIVFAAVRNGESLNADGSVRRSGETTISEDGNEILVDGVHMKIGKGHFRLASHIIRSVGRTVSWDEAGYALSRNKEDVHVACARVALCYVRKALAAAGSNVEINTVRGAGIKCVVNLHSVPPKASRAKARDVRHSFESERVAA